MNNEIKVNLNITLQGSVMMSEKECSKNPKDNYSTFSMQIVDDVKGKEKRYTINPQLRKSIPATQTINLSKEAYNYMTSMAGVTTKIKVKVWENMSPRLRLEHHLRLISESVGGVSFNYVVFGD